MWPRGTPAVEWYDGPCLFEALDGLDFKAFEERPFRFPVQDVYDIDGTSIVAGRIESGEVSEGMDVFLLTEGTRCRIKEIKKYQADGVKKALYGDSIGLIVEGASGIIKEATSCPGQTIQGSPTASRRTFSGFTVHTMGRTASRYGSLPRKQPVPWRSMRNSILRLWTEKPTGLDRLEVGEVAKVTIRTENPIAIDPFLYIPEMGQIHYRKEGYPRWRGIVS